MVRPDPPPRRIRRPCASRHVEVALHLKPATASAGTPSGRFRTGSNAKRADPPCETTFEAFECASTATSEAIRCGSASRRWPGRTIRRLTPCGPAVARRRADRAGTRRRCWCPPRSPRRRRRTSRRRSSGSRRLPVGGPGRLEHQFLVGDVRRRRGEPRPSDACDAYPRFHGRVIPWSRGRRMDPDPGLHRSARTSRGSCARTASSTYRGARRALDGRHRLVLGRRRAGPRASSSSSPTTRCVDTLARAGVGDVVHGGHDEPGAPVRRPMGGPHARRPVAVDLGGRGRRGPPASPTRELRELTDRARERPARRWACGRATRSGMFMPMAPETVAARHGVREARRDLPADLLRLRRRRGGGPAGRRRREGADHGRRVPAARASVVPMKETADAAVDAGADACDTSWSGTDSPAARSPMIAGRDVAWDDLLAGQPERVRDRARSTASTRCSSPTRAARPAGRRASVHVHGGFLVKIAEEVAFQIDLRPGESLFWLTDIGWIMGPWEIVGTLALGATVLLYDGAPDYPGPDRLWAIGRAAPRHDARRLAHADPRADGARRRAGATRTTCRRCASSARPASRGTPSPGGGTSTTSAAGRCPVINISGGTEVGACFLSPLRRSRR